MRVEDFKLIQNIIERDSTDTSYKYALLKAVIEISQESDHLMVDHGEEVEFPLGLIVEKWLYYYFPIFASNTFVPQKNGETEDLEKGNRLAFRLDYLEVIEYYISNYEQTNAYTMFVNDLRNSTIPEEISGPLEVVVKKIRQTLKDQPMRYLGKSHFNEEYQVFQYQTKWWSTPQQSIDRTYIINELDTFTFSKHLYELFHFIGTFIAGENSILTTWAEFTTNVDKTGTWDLAKTIQLLKTDVTETREVRDVRTYFVEMLETKQLHCVWSDKIIKSAGDLAIDHMIPFSAWKNNDIWNLLPTLASVNGSKSNKIPTKEVLKQSKAAILGYWRELWSEFGVGFVSQMTLGLAGNVSEDILLQVAFEQLQEKCEYLITIRGYEPYTIAI